MDYGGCSKAESLRDGLVIRPSEMVGPHISGCISGCIRARGWDIGGWIDENFAMMNKN